MYYSKSSAQTKNEKRKRIQQNKKQKKREKQKIIKNETCLLEKIRDLPSDLIDYIYLFINNDIKFYISHYFNLYKKYVINYKYNDLNCIYKGYEYFEYYTFYKLSSPLQEMLKKIPIDKIKQFLFCGTPNVYFKIAFPLEHDIWEYIHINYRINKSMEEKRKDYIFEIIDILSYFVTIVNDKRSYKNYDCKDYRIFKDSEIIVKKYILSILYMYEKYAIV